MVARALVLILLLLAAAAPAALFEPPTMRVMAHGTFRITEPLHVGPGETLVVRNATLFLDVRGAVPAILIDGGTLRVEQARLDTSLDPHEHGGWVLAGKQGAVVLRGATVANYSAFTLEFPGPAPSLVEGSTFTTAVGPVAFVRGASVDVRTSAFTDVGAGLLLRDAPGSVVDNVFRRVSGPGRALDVQMSSLGDASPTAGAPRVERNLVEDSNWGMLNVNGDGNVVRGNVFRNNVVGLTLVVPHGDAYTRTRPPLVEGNAFEGNHASLVVGLATRGSTVTDALVPVHGNAFLSTRCMHVHVPERTDARVLVDAAGNWWGTPEGPPADAPGCPVVTPGVLVAPWLAEWRGAAGT